MIKGIGTDIIEIKRIEMAITRRPKLQKRLFTRAELEYCFGKPNPWASLAARFAAKEAVMKAMGVGPVTCPFHEIEIVKKSEGGPSIRLHGKALAVAQRQCINQWHLSLSHSKTEAVAFVTAENITNDPKLEGKKCI